MKLSGTLIVVEDIKRSLDFYKSILGLEVLYDFGEDIAFKGGLSIHLKSHFPLLTGIDENRIMLGGNNSELYFEDRNLDDVLKILERNNVTFIHKIVEHSFGQRTIRFYDPDRYIIEIGEPMEYVVERFLRSGMSVDEVIKKTQMPEDFVLNVKSKL